MSCHHNDNCKLRKIGTDNKAICLKCGRQFHLEEIDSEASASSVLATLVVAVIVCCLVIVFHQSNSVIYESEPSQVEVNSGK